jgi:undecaprenyl diphosphate synthase
LSTKSSILAPFEANLPAHVAIIMDGNGRWAQQQGKLRTFGHKAGVKAVRASVSYARRNGIKALTLFAFSSENWRRPKDEVTILIQLFNLVLSTEIKKLNKNNIRLKVIGDLSAFDQKLVDKIRKAELLTKKKHLVNTQYCSQLWWALGHSNRSSKTC